MLATILLHVVSVLFAFSVNGDTKYDSGSNHDYDAAVEFLEEIDPQQSQMMNKVTLANWAYASNLTEENKQRMLDVKTEQGNFEKEGWKKATSFAWKDFKDRNETIYRWFKHMAVLGNAALKEDDYKKFNQIIAEMEDTYAKAKVCSKGKDPPCDLSLEPEITEIMAESRDYDKLKRIWSDWHDATGKKVKSKFLDYVKLTNKAARINGFEDASEMWTDNYETDTFKEDVEKLWAKLMPFYKQLHAYVRRKLIQTYPDKNILPDGPIPAHVLGDMWAQNWDNIFSVVLPYPKKKPVDVSENMRRKNMTPKDMFKLSENFFTSLGLRPMTPEFWKRSIIEKPKDREMVCHASAWDFYNRRDFRIKMCTRVDMKDFFTVHHEMGHVAYFMQYADQLAVFRNGANNGFHEAIGDVMSLSVSTNKHLRKIGLLEDDKEDNETMINSLMKKALEKIAFLPFGYLVDAWRWKVFEGDVPEYDINGKWWEMRLKYQGLCPPVRRTNHELDAAAKYHVISDVPYIRYFVSHIIQFQFHKALCDAAGQDGPLHECDIYQSKEAGKVLGDMLSLGSSVHWREAMNIVTRGKTRKMDVEPVLEYFEPLIKWLKKQNEFETIGWKSNDPMICPFNPSL